MKIYRRSIAILLLSALLLTGCGADSEISGQIAPAESAVPEETFAGQVAPEETTAPEEKPVSLGRMEGGVYTNAYAGFGCALDSTWQFYTAEELQQLPEDVDAALEGSQLGELTSDMVKITDMMAENVNDLTNISILYTKLSMQERLAYATMSEEACIDAVLSEADMLTESYAQADIEVTSIEKIQVTFLGETHFAAKTTATIQGMGYYVLQLMDNRAGQYGITVTLASFLEDRTESLLELFYPVD